MEKERTIIALVFSLLAILIYFHFFAPRRKPPPRPPAHRQVPQQPTQAPARPIPEKPDTPEEQPAPVPAEVPQQPPVAAAQGTIRTGTLEMNWRNGAAAIRDVVLTAREDDRYLYPDHTRENPLRLLFSQDREDFMLRLCKSDSAQDIVNGNWKVVKEAPAELVMEGIGPGGITITKRFAFSEESYDFLFEVRLRNTTGAKISPSYRVLVSNGILEETGRGMPGGAVVARREGGNLNISRVAPAALTDEKPKKEFTAGGAWAGLENKYFAAVLAPRDKVTSTAVQSILVERAFPPPEEPTSPKRDEPRLLNIRAVLVTKEIPIEVEDEVIHRYLFYVGPKHDDALGKYREFGFDRLINYGWFGFLSKLFLWILRGIHSVLPNWGVAIIILTLIVRGCLHPVSRKSQISMYKHQQAMQKLKPKIDKLKAKHKNSRQKFAQEQMKLLKEEGVSMIPTGGCLLLPLQIPVFIGLYWALSLSIELRQASFVLWINDLSKQDAVFTLPSNIPILGTPHINILPILMLAAMVFQQLTQPRPPDPQVAQQQKMTMFIMLFVLGFIFYSMPSGLVLYFLTSTLVGIAETRYVRRKLAAEAQE